MGWVAVAKLVLSLKFFWDLLPCHWNLSLYFPRSGQGIFPWFTLCPQSPGFSFDYSPKSLCRTPLTAHFPPTQSSSLEQNLEQRQAGWITFPTTENTHASLTQESLRMEINLDIATFPLLVPSEKLAKPVLATRCWKSGTGPFCPHNGREHVKLFTWTH